jgi:hypothetical protein
MVIQSHERLERFIELKVIMYFSEVFQMAYYLTKEVHTSKRTNTVANAHIIIK